MLTQSWYDSTGEDINDDVIKGVWSSSGAVQSPSESPLPSSGDKKHMMVDGRAEEEGDREWGPLVPALLSKLERLLDQVSIYMYSYICPHVETFTASLCFKQP